MENHQNADFDAQIEVALSLTLKIKLWKKKGTKRGKANYFLAD